MKLKRILLFTLAFVILGTATALANDTFEWYKGKSVKVVVNGQELESPGLLIAGEGEFADTTMLPLRDIASTLQAVVKWDASTETVNIHKPNVHISMVQRLKDGAFGTFGQVIHKTKYKFYIFTQADNITTKVHSFKVTMTNPNGNEVYSYIFDDLSEQKENVWLGTEEIDLEFKELGKYTVKVFMKVDADAEYSLVSRKSIPSIDK